MINLILKTIAVLLLILSVVIFKVLYLTLTAFEKLHSIILKNDNLVLTNS